jgi:uncharacterized DUF497 family protein
LIFVIFLWDDFNRAHATKHGVKKEDAEFVVEHASPPYPRRKEKGKLLVWGADRAGRIVEVIYAMKTAEEIEFESIDPMQLADVADQENVVGVYIIHAMPLDGRRLKQYRRSRR